MFFVDIEKYNVIYLTKQCFLRFCSSCQDSINQEAILAISFVCIVTVLTSKFKNYFLWYCMMHEAEGVMSFMSREHLLLHTGEDTIHDPKIEKKNLSPKDKRENFWFYHKWHIVIVLVVLVFAALLSKDFFNRVNPDYEIGLLTKTSFPEDAVNQLQEALAEKAVDRNNDGQVIVRVNQYVIVPGSGEELTSDGQAASAPAEGSASASSSAEGQEASSQYVDANMQMASMVKFSVDTQDDQSIIFLVAEDSIDYFQNSYHLFAKSDYSSPDMESSDTGDIGIPWEELPYLDGLKLTVQSWDDNYNDIEVDVTDSFRELRVCIRDFEQLSHKDDQATIDYYNDSKELLESLKTK